MRDDKIKNDNRVRLSPNAVIRPQDSVDVSYVIDSDPDRVEYGCGGSSIVYRAQEMLNDTFKRDVLLKELFPIKGYLRGNDATIKAELPGMEDRLDDYEQMMWVEHDIGHNIIRDDPWAAAIEPPFTDTYGNRYAVIGTAPPGITLKDLLQDPDSQNISLRAYLVLFYRLADAVRRIHEAGYLHLDISPSNIRIIDRNDVKGTIKSVAAYDDPGREVQYVVMMIDFGCSLRTDEDGMALKYDPSPTTEGYSAPELTLDTDDWIDCRTDIYSICACFGRCTAGLPEISGKNAEVKAELDSLIKTGMATDPLSRWKDAEKLLDLLSDLIQKAGERVPSENEIRIACEDWIDRAKQTGRLVNYSAAEQQGELFNIPLTARISSDNVVDREKGSEIERILFGKESVENIMLTGSGGSGKTFMLLELADKILGKQLPSDLGSKAYSYMPLYVPLNKLNDSADGIIDYCKKMFCSKDMYCGPKRLPETVVELFHGHMRVYPLLLLDGFNEITSSERQDDAVKEIARITSAYPCVRFVVSSRFDFSSSFDGKGSNIFSRREVLELEPDVIIDYLMKTVSDQFGGSMSKMEAKRFWDGISYKMQKTLRRPMALSMFVQTKQNRHQGHNFPFPRCHRLAELLANYSYLLLKAQISDDVKVDKMTSILSYIGFKMVNGRTFEVCRDDLIEWICDCAPALTSEEIDDIISVFRGTVLRSQSGGIFRFAHQNLRDFHCARYIAGGLGEMATTDNPSLLCDKYFPAEHGHEASTVYDDEILLLLGDYTQDYQENTESVIDMAICRNKSSQNDPSVRRVIRQLIRASTLARDDLHRFSFSGLDISDISLNRVKLYYYDETGRKTAGFDGTAVSDDTFIPQGHANAVFAMCLAADRYLISFSQHTICCYDVITGAYDIVGSFPGTAPTVAATIDNETVWVATQRERATGLGRLYRFFVKEIPGKRSAEFNLETDYPISFAGQADRIERITEDTVAVAVSAKDSGTVYIFDPTADIFGYDVNSLESVDQYIIEPLNSINKSEEAKCSVSHYEYRGSGRFHRSVSKNLMYIAFADSIDVVDLKTKTRSEFFRAAYNGNTYRIMDICAIKYGLLVYTEQDTDSGTEFRVFLLDENGHERASCDGELESVSTIDFGGYSRFNRRLNLNAVGDVVSEDVFICRDDNNAQTPDAYKLLFDQSSLSQNRICVRSYNMGQQNLSVIDSVCIPGDKLATCSRDRSVQLLDINGNTPAMYFPGNNNGIHGLCICDSDNILCAQYSGEVSLWSRSGDDKWYCSAVYDLHDNWIWDAEIYERGDKVFIITSSYDHTVKITDERSEEILKTIYLDDQVLAAHILSDGNIIAHTHHKIVLVKVHYPDDCSMSCEYDPYENIDLYESPGEKFMVRDIYPSKDERFVYAAVNHNEGDLAASLFRIDLNSTDLAPDRIATLLPSKSSDVRQYVIRCMHMDGDLLVVGGDVKNRDPSKSGFVAAFRLNGNECALIAEPLLLNCRVSRLKIHKNVIYTVANNGMVKAVRIDPSGNLHAFDCYSVNTQMLDIEIFEGYIYVATLDGAVYKDRLPDPSDLGKEGLFPDRSNCLDHTIIETVSGFRMCGVDLTNAKKLGNWQSIEGKIKRYLSDDGCDVFN